MPTKDELEQNYQANIDILNYEYYHAKTMPKADFLAKQTTLKDKYIDDLTNIGEPLPPNWKALWLAADTTVKKLAVIAKRLELE